MKTILIWFLAATSLTLAAFCVVQTQKFSGQQTQLISLKLVFYSKIAPRLENLQQQAIFDGAFSQTSECSAKF